MTDNPNEIWVVIDDPGDLITKKVSGADVWVEEGCGGKYIRATPELEALIEAAVEKATAHSAEIAAKNATGAPDNKLQITMPIWRAARHRDIIAGEALYKAYMNYARSLPHA